MKYVCILEPDPSVTGEPGYHAYFPSLKGCHTSGTTVEETLANAREALEAFLEGLSEDGIEHPRPDVPDDNLGAIAVLIEAAEEGR